MSKKPDYSDFFNFNPLPSWVYDLKDLHIIEVNQAAIKHYGYSKEEFLSLTLKDLRPPREVPKLINAHANIKTREGNIYFGIFIHQKKDGTLIQMEINGHKVDFNDRQCILVVCQDVTEQKQKELEKELLGKISLNFSSEKDLLTSSKLLCQTICDYGQFDFAELWMPNIENTRVQLIAKTSASTQANSFYRTSENVRSFKLGEGLPGAVWKKRSTLLWKDISKKSEFVRQKAAEKAGIQTALGIPLRFNDQIVGVLLVGTQEKLSYLKKYVKLFEHLQHFIGSEINRKKLENELSHLYDAIPDIISVGDFQGKILRINKAGCDLLGYTEEEILHQGFEKFIHPDDLDIAMKEMSQLKAGHSTFGFEVRFLTKSDDLLWLSWYCKANVNERLIYSSAKNITEEKKLRKLNKQASDLAKLGSWEYDMIENNLFWSDEVHRLHETDPNTFVPNVDRAIDFYKEVHKSFVEDVIYKSINEGVDLDYEAVIITRSKKERWIRVIASPEFNEGKCVKFIGSYQEITDRKEAELAVIESEAKFKTIFEIATLGIIQVDPLKGRIILANSHYETITGYTNEELLKMSFVDLTHPDDRKKDWELFNKAAGGEGEYRNEKRYVKKDGTIIWVRLHVAFIRDETGKPIKTVAICEGITDRKEVEARLQNISDNIPGVVYQYLLHPDGTDEFRYVSKGAEKIWGYSSEAVTENLNLVWDQIKAGGNFERVKQSIIDSVKNKSPWSIRYRTFAADGEKRILHGVGTPEFSADGTVLYNSVVLDVTQESKNQELLDDVVKLTKIGSWEVNLINNSIFWTDQVHRIYETDPATFVPHIDEAINFYREDYQQLALSSFEKCMITGDAYDIEAVIVTANKKERWVRTTAKAEIVDGVCTRVYGSFQDIHERKEAEIRLQTLADNLPGVVFQYHLYPDGKDALKAITKGAQKVWGFAADEVMENNQLVWNQILLGGDIEIVQKSISDSVASKSKWSAQWKYVMPNGELKTHLGYGSPNYLSDGTVVFNSVILDITAEAKNEELLEQVSKMGKIGGWELNLKTMKPYFSEQTFQIYELPPGTPPKIENGIKFYAKEAQPIINNAVTEAIENHTPYDLELPFITSKGNKIWVKTSGKVDVVDGVAIRLYGAIQDITEQKIAEKELESVTERLQLATEAANIGIWDWDITQNKLIWDEKMYEIFNVNPSEFKGAYEAFEATVHPDDIQQANKDVQNAINGVSEFDSNFRIIWKDNSIHYLQANALIERDENGKAIRMVGTNWDITKEKIAKEQVELALQEKNNILESIGDAFFAVDKNWLVTYWNKEAESILGRKREEIVGENLWEVYADAIDSDFNRQYHKAMETGEDVEFEEYYPTINKWFAVSAYPSQDGLSIYFKDVTLKKEADLRLIQANERFEKVTEATTDAIWDWDIKNNSFYRSDAIDRFFGEGTVKQLQGRGFWQDRFHQEDLERLQESLQLALKDSSCDRWEMQYRVLNDKDEIVYVNDRALIVRNKKGKAMRMIGAMTDITERKNFEKQLIELNDSLKKHTHDLEITNQELEQFAYIASHDLQEPLRMVTSFMDLLKRRYEDQLDDKALQYIGFATDGAKRMKQIIVDLLEFSRAGKLNISPVKISTNKILEDYQVLRKRIIAEKNVRLEIDSLPTINSYTAPLTQTLHCLLDNAIKYSRKEVNPILKVKVKELADYWQFSVEDNGIGIDPKFFDKIFIIFQRLHNRNEFSGSGIGLSVAKKHVESWGGTIRLESTPGEGSTFYFTIPKT